MNTICYEAIIKNAFTINQEIFSKNSQYLMFGKPIPAKDQGIMDKMNTIIGTTFNVLINDFGTEYSEENDLISLTLSETFCCPKNYVFGDNKPITVFEPKVEPKPVKEDVVVSSSEPEAVEPDEEQKETIQNEATDIFLTKEEETPIVEEQPIIEESISEPIPEPVIEEQITTIEKPVVEDPIVEPEQSSEMDFASFFDAEPVETVEEPKETKTIGEEMDFSSYFEDATPNEEPIAIETPIEENTSELDFGSYFENTENTAPQTEEAIIQPINEVKEPINEESVASADNFASSLLNYCNEPRSEKITNVTNNSIIEPIDETDDFIPEMESNSNEFEPEKQHYNFQNTGLSHEGAVVNEYKLPKNNAIYTIFDLYITPGGIGNKERMQIMVAPLENRDKPDANVPIIVSAFYNGKHFTKSSIETIDAGKNLITFDVVNFHFLVRGSFDQNLKFKASINTTGKSIADGTKISLIKESNYGTVSGEKYNGLHFTFNEKDDLTNCFVFPLKDNESSEFICILQTNEFIDYPYCSKTLVGTEKISIDNNGQRQELSCEWEGDYLKAKLVEVTYG